MPTTCAETARDVIRGGWGIYQDFGYTNSNVLFAAIDASGQGHGPIFSVNNTDRHSQAGRHAVPRRRPHQFDRGAERGGSHTHPAFRSGCRAADAAALHAADEHRLGAPVERVDRAHRRRLHIEGRDLNVRFRYNYLDPATGVRRLSGLDIRPNTQGIRLGISGAESLYNGLIVGLRRRMTQGLDLAASYTLGSATSNMGTASDELDANYVQDVTDPFADVQLGPSGRSDARHRSSASAVVRLPWGFQAAPFFVFRSALPIFTFEGVDRNHDGNNNDITVKAYRYDGLGKAPKEIGDCAHINCSRGAPLTAAERSGLEVVPGDRDTRGSKRSPKCSMSSTRSTRRSR